MAWNNDLLLQNPPSLWTHPLLTLTSPIPTRMGVDTHRLALSPDSLQGHGDHCPEKSATSWTVLNIQLVNFSKVIHFMLGIWRLIRITHYLIHNSISAQNCLLPCQIQMFLFLPPLSLKMLSGKYSELTLVIRNCHNIPSDMMHWVEPNIIFWGILDRTS